MADEHNQAFEQVLARVAERLGDPEDASLPAVGAAIRTFRTALDHATNMGETGDDRDVYALLDRMVAVVRQVYPGVRCASGCSGCCDSETAIFDAWPEEWARIVAHVKQHWTPAQRQTFKSRFDALHGQRLLAYRALGHIGHFEPVADAYWARSGGYRCPFLDAGRCSIYAARPLACRMYGYFAVRKRWLQAPTVYACRMQTDYFETVPGELALPSLQAVTARVSRLVRKPRWLGGGAARILPLWIADQWPESPPGTMGSP